MPIVLPSPPVRRLSPSETGAIARRARKLLRRGDLTHRQLVLLDAILWSCRSPATGAIVASYTKLSRLAHMARNGVVVGVRRLEALGLLSKVKRRVRLTWANGGTASRQATNAYILHPPPDTEFPAATVNRELEILYVRQPENRAVKQAQEGLNRARRMMEERLRFRLA